MKQHDSTVERIRDLMAAGNPAPTGSTAVSSDDEQKQHAYQRIIAATQNSSGSGVIADTAVRNRRAGRRRLSGGLSTPGGRAWRGLAPLAAGLAVAALVVGLTVVGGSHSARPGTGTSADETDPTASGVPQFYLTLANSGGNGLTAPVVAVHSSQTGQVISRLEVGDHRGFVEGIAAEPPGRTFLAYESIYTGTRKGNPTGDKEVVLYRLRVSRDGHAIRSQRLRMVLMPPGSHEWLMGVAVSPDGSELAAAFSRGPSGSLTSHAAIRVYSLTGGGTKTWTAPGRLGTVFSPVWTSDHQLTFVWQDHLRGSAVYFYLGRSQVRVLNTSTPGHSLLASKVVMTEGGKFSLIQSLGAGSADSPVVVAVIHVTSLGGQGTETRQLVELSASASAGKVLVSTSHRYSGLQQEGLLSATCQVLGVTPAGAMLAESPHFGLIVNGKFTPVGHTATGPPAGVYAAAW
jgi:hypothetical protein